MHIILKPGSYIVAVSGGIDSMALLHALRNLEGVRLTVAHFDHGMRPDSHLDVLLVQSAAKHYGLPFVYTEGRLGAGASEAVARKARYDFLHKVCEAAGTDAIITAHHKDDVLETAIINMMRGTGRKGLTSLKSIDGIKRPLLHITKAEILAYAEEHGLQWREDSTNSDTAYLRNHIRRNILPAAPKRHKDRLHGVIQHMHGVNEEIDELINDFLQRHAHGSRLQRKAFIKLPHAVALEVMAAWLRANGLRGFDKKMLERLTHAAKIHTVGRQVPITGSVNLKINGEFLALTMVER